MKAPEPTTGKWEFVVNRRKSLGLTQIEAAEQIGISQPTYSAWECRECAPEMRHIRQMAQVLQISPTDLIQSIADIFFS